MVRRSLFMVGILLGTSAAEAQTPTLHQTTPFSGSYVNTRRPEFRWAGGDGSGTVQVCADRACARVLVSLTGAQSTARATQDLPRGAAFWRVTSGGTTTPSWPVHVVGNGSRTAPYGFVTDLNGDGRADILRVAETGRGTRVSTYDAQHVATAIPGVPRARRLIALGDINGDGFTDVVAGTGRRRSFDSAGVLLGSEQGLRRAPRFVFRGTGPSGQNITAMAPAGDVDGDGFGDVVVSVRRDQRTLEAQLLRGGAAGFTAVVLGTFQNVTDGPRSSDEGNHVTVVWDADGNGRAELLVQETDATGSPPTKFMTMRAIDAASFATPLRTFRAPSTVVSPYDNAPENSFGTGSVGLGDVNGDGFNDFAIGSLSCFAVYHGAATMPVNQAFTRCVTRAQQPDQSVDFSGSRLISLPDANGDGFADLVVASESAGADSSGETWLFVGSARGFVQTPAANPAYEDTIWSGRAFGSAVHSPGDVNGDGFTDLVIEAAGYNPVGDFNPADTGLFFYAGAASGLPHNFTWMVR